MITKVSRFLRGHSAGQGAVEFAGALLFLLALLFGIAQAGVFYYTVISVNTAAREAARVASENPNDTGLFSSPYSPAAPLTGPPPFSCSTSSTVLACKAAYNSTNNALGGLIDQTKLQVTLSGSKYASGTPTACPQGTGTTDGVVTVKVGYNAPVFVPLVGSYFSGLNPLTATIQIRVEPCTSTFGS